MKGKYSKYTIDELIQDDYFISSVLHPSQESQDFWELLIQGGNVSAEDFEKASLFIKAMQSRKEKLFRKEKETLWNKIEIENKKNLKKKVHTLYVTSLSAAACVLLLLGLSAYLFNGYKSEKKSIDSYAQLKDKPDFDSVSDICLILSEDKQIVFEENNTDVKYNNKGEVKVNSQTVAESKKAEIKTKEKAKEAKQPTVYNQLVVPKGKHSTLLLSDGTKLWINAGSHVIFPVVFEKDKREIYVDGEVFLDVARNESCPFVVKTDRIHVEVLGTSFNVNSYGNKKEDNIVLVTGSVYVKTESGKKAELSPNQRFSCTSAGTADIQTVDVYDYISWKDGLLQYRQERLSVILQRLSDYYGKSIRWEPELTEVTCSGKLDLKEDIDKVLNGLTKMIPVKYTKQNESYFFSMNP